MVNRIGTNKRRSFFLVMGESEFEIICAFTKDRARRNFINQYQGEEIYKCVYVKDRNLACDIMYHRTNPSHRTWEIVEEIALRLEKENNK